MNDHRPERALDVLHPGLLTLVQDLGRPGNAALGVGRSGAADLAAAAHANRLVGNPAEAAVLETVLGGLRMRLRADLIVAVTGTSAGIAIDGHPVPGHVALNVPAGSELTVEAPQQGLRTYLAVAGGVAVDPVLGSRSYDTLARLGPPPVRAGDVLPVGDTLAEPLTGPGVWRGLPGGDVVLDIDPGPRHHWFDVQTLLDPRWQVGPDLDRVGVRLTGAQVRRITGGELPSEGVVRGAVQIPADGAPVLFGADHPTTGGYPVIAVLTDAASDLAAQLRPGAGVRFRWHRSRSV